MQGYYCIVMLRGAGSFFAAALRLIHVVMPREDRVAHETTPNHRLRFLA